MRGGNGEEGTWMVVSMRSAAALSVAVDGARVKVY
jgi:hypothetical protein